MELPRLTRSQIEEYNAFTAFSIDRPTWTPESVAQNNVPFITESAQQSVGLIQNLETQFGTIESNLFLMLEAADKGSAANISDDKKAEYYAQLRSLSAGLDLVVRDYEIDGKKLLDGHKLELATGNTDPLRLEIRNVASSGENSLELSEKVDGADIAISFDQFSLIKNVSSDILGLDITEGRYKAPEFAADELADGKYYVEVTYMGADSEVRILDSFMNQKARVTGIDLSGTGQELVDFGNGVELSFEKIFTPTDNGGDKQDFETDGPQKLFAVLDFFRTKEHHLKDDEVSSAADLRRTHEVAFSRDYSLEGDTGQLNFTLERTGIPEGNELATGNYTMRIQYDGENSSAWLYDFSGRLVKLQRNIDLTQTEDQKIDLGYGFRIAVENEGFTSAESRRLTTSIDYTAPDKPYQSFDFRAYAREVDAALTIVQEQIFALQDAREEVTERFQQAQLAQQGASSGGADPNNTAIQLLGQGSIFGLVSLGINLDDNPLFASQQASADLSAATAGIFGSMEELNQLQADVDPAILARL